ncbi:hypothetical protein M3484_04720 [Pseudomonas sp. GX19020]|nr:hypothetical protein [Pseudomonas sp. GX19020]MCL4065866.1 hypothetical protein [Pseudomonas sp. GX19020]
MSDDTSKLTAIRTGTPCENLMAAFGILQQAVLATDHTRPADAVSRNS